MSDLFAFTPTAPDFAVNWDEIDRQCPLVRALAGCPQDPIHHAEGDVWIHTRMVCESLASLQTWQNLPDEDRRIVFVAAVLHDVAKPECTRTDENGRITSRGHSRRGAIVARQLLWRAGVPFARREEVCALIRHHQMPYWLIDRPDPRRPAIEVSQTARCDLLTLLAEADVRGRICADQQRLLDNVALFAEQVRELGCFTSPYEFSSDHARVLFFLDESRIPEAPAHVNHRCEVVLTSGLPGSGKDHFISTHLNGRAVISLDELRDELDVDPDDDQGVVISAARERAREYLRRGEPFVWNASNVSREVRSMTLKLLASYQARIRIVYLEAPPDVLAERMKKRGRVVPARVIERMLDRWEVPDRTEVGIQCLVVDGQRILLGKRKEIFGSGTWGLPGGHLEKDETIIEAATRELYEETNLVAISSKIVAITDPLPEANYHLQIGIQIDKWSGELINKESDYCSELAFFELSNLPFPLFIASIPLIEKFRQGILY